MSKNKKHKAEILFEGYSNEDVSGSSYLIKYKNDNTLVDFGLFQSSNPLEQYQKNTRDLKFKPKDIKSIVLTHIHVDHVGLVCRLYKLGCEANIYVVKGSKKFLKEMWTDCAKIMGKDCIRLSKMYKRKFKQIYSKNEVDIALSKIIEVDYHNPIKVGNYTELKFMPSGHIIHSAQIDLYINDTDINYRKRMLFAFDLGNYAVPRPFVEDFYKADKYYDVVLGETTYAMSEKRVGKKLRKRDLEKLKNLIDNCEGDVILPSFSLQRSQELIYIIYQLYKNDSNFSKTVILDSPLASRLTKIFAEEIPDKEERLEFNKMLDWCDLHIISDWQTSNELLKSKENKICISSSGFLNGGRILNWLEESLPVEDNVIVFNGYAPPDSLAENIRKNRKYVTINNKKIKKEAKAYILSCFSSHIQHIQMLRYYSSLRCGDIYLVHGNKDNQVLFKELLEEKYKKELKTTKVHVSEMGSKIEL